MKKKMSILRVNRPLKEEEHVVKDVFMKYGRKYDLIIFPPKGDDPGCRIQVVFFNYSLLRELEGLFNVYIDYDPDDLGEFFDFDLTEIEEDVFCDVLSQIFELSVFDLTNVEK